MHYSPPVRIGGATGAAIAAGVAPVSPTAPKALVTNTGTYIMQYN